jgi:hypothetical protein
MIMMTMIFSDCGILKLGSPMGRDHWEDLGVGEKMNVRETVIDGANWIQLAQDRVQWRVFVSTVMNLRVP